MCIRDRNYAEWPEVYSADGGRYQMTVHYSFGKGRQLEGDVNGIVTKIESLGEDAVSYTHLDVYKRQYFLFGQLGNLDFFNNHSCFF